MTCIKEYILGDMTARYLKDERGIVGIQLLPAACKIPDDLKKDAALESLVQIKIAGDVYGGAYEQGLSMRNGETATGFLYKERQVDEKDNILTIRTILQDHRGLVAEHVLRWEKGDLYVTMFTIFKNYSTASVSLEMLASFSLGQLTPYVEGDAYESMDLYRVRSVWSGEGKLQIDSVEELALETAWAHHAVRCERFGQVGSMPVNHFFPFGAVYDKKNHIFWGAELAHNASWQMEFYRKDEGLSFSGGLADREFGHWQKTVMPQECFETPKAIVSTACINIEDAQHHAFDLFTQRLTSAALKAFCKSPSSEQELPVVFNEYCTTWGNPSAENIEKILQSIRGMGFSYFVIDCGWYKQDGILWDMGMGDYEVSSQLFPKGLEKTVEQIKQEGLVPGIWFEIENVAKAAKAYQYTEHLLHRDGKILTTDMRRFWNMKDPWVQQYLHDKVIGTLQHYGFGYMKIDYNETIGIGCDGAESLGEGLRQNMEAVIAFINQVKEEVPGIVLENCASGGHRLEPLMMSLCSMASFSDAHECKEIPIIAANLHRLIHPAQSQIWAVIRKEDDVQRIVYSVANTFLGRMCISGDVTELSDEQRYAITTGISFYKKAASVIKEGTSLIYRSSIKSMRHPKGWQGVVRSTKDRCLVVIHTFDEIIAQKITLPLGLPGEEWASASKIAVYGEEAEPISVHKGKVTIQVSQPFCAFAVLVTRED